MSELRSFHNYVKSRILSAKGTSLLDIGVGKAGDLHKWVKHGYKIVRGVDVNLESLREAEKRTATKTKNTGEQLDYKYFPIGTTIDEHIEPMQFDVVSCQFAIHYYFDTWDHFDELLDTVSRRLKPGGHFIVTCMNGDELFDIPKPFQNGVLSIQDTDVPNGLLVSLKDTDYFRDDHILEYYVFSNPFIGACEEANLKLVQKRSFDQFLPKYKGDRLKDMQKETTAMCVCYTFQKM